MIVDSDAHVLEPADLFTSVGLPIPGHEWQGLTVEGVRLPDIGGAPAETDQHALYSALGPAYVEAAAQGFGPAAHLAAMDREGVDFAVLFPTRSGWLVGDFAPALISRATKRYNEWIATFCASGNRGEITTAAAPRLGAVGLVSWADVPSAIATAHHAVVDLGLLGIATRPNPLGGRTLDHPDNDPLWATIAALGVPLILHEGTGARTPALGVDRALTRMGAHIFSHAFEQMAAVYAFTVGGIFARHPTLRVGFFEAGAWWVPGWLERLDSHAMGPFGAQEYTLPRRPSWYFRRQGWVTTDGEDLHGIDAEQLADRVLFATDFPHPDGKFPFAVREARATARGLWSKISADNAAPFWFGGGGVGGGDLRGRGVGRDEQGEG